MRVVRNAILGDGAGKCNHSHREPAREQVHAGSTRMWPPVLDNLDKLYRATGRIADAERLEERSARFRAL